MISWAGQAIERHFLLLETATDIGRPFAEMSELRELVIAFVNASLKLTHLLAISPI